MNGFVYSGGLVPGMESNAGVNDLSFDGGDPGLNYRFQSVPDGNENNYTENQGLDEEENFKLNLFPCRRSCKEKLGGKGPGFRDCLRECRGKGPRKSKQAQIDSELTAKAIAALTASDASAQRQQGGSKTWIWILVSVLVLIGIGVGIYFLARKKAQ